MTFLSFLISGISLGSIYAIIALGYTMVYGIAKMLNFAHGDVIMVGAYICFYATTRFELPAIVGVILAIIVCTVLGIVIERLAYKPLRAAPILAVLITAIGVSYFLQNAALLLWSSNPKVFTSVIPKGNISLFGGQLTIPYVTLVTIVVCIIIMIALVWFTSKTKMGKAMRACSEDKGAAQLMGINVNGTSPACCCARPIPPWCRPPAPCLVSRPLRRPCSAASGPSPALCWAACCWASSRSLPRPISPPSSRTPLCSRC